MPDLSLQKKAKRLRIYISEKDRWRGNSLDVAWSKLCGKKGLLGQRFFGELWDMVRIRWFTRSELKF